MRREDSSIVFTCTKLENNLQPANSNLKPQTDNLFNLNLNAKHQTSFALKCFKWEASEYDRRRLEVMQCNGSLFENFVHHLPHLYMNYVAIE